MSTLRDGKTFIISIKQKYPQYKDVDDVTLLSMMQKKYPEYRDVSLDSVPNSENLLQRAISGSVAGIPSAVAPGVNRPEDALPMIAQFGTDFAMKATPQGRIASLTPGVPMATTVGATTGAEGIRQFTKGLRGEKPNYGKMGETALITAGTEGIGRTAETAFFRSEIGKTAIKGAKKRLGQALEKLFEVAKNDPTISIMKDDLVGFLEYISEGIPFKIGPQATGFKNVINTIRKNFPDTLGPREIAHTENILGDIASFDPTKSGELKNKLANISVKEARSQISGLVDDMGIAAGVPEVKLAGKEAHLAQKKYSSKKQGLAEIVSNRVTRPGVVGGAVGKLSGNPLLGFGVAGADLLMQSEPVKNALYNLIVRSGASRGSRVGISELLRKSA